MYLFVNDIPITILKSGSEPDRGDINHRVDASKEEITRATLIHHVWIRNAGLAELETILGLVNSKVPLHVLSITISVGDYKEVKAFLRKKFKIVNAAGGLIVRKDRYLLIYRMKKWDLPKGKNDPGETSRITAQREVQEECNIEVKVGRRLVTTWHTYTMNKNNMLKRTRWYLMEVVDDSKMKPEKGEQIEEIRWMSAKEAYHALENSYNSIRFVFARYYNALEANRSKPARSRSKSKA